jgi:hypothetical protein
MLVMYDVLLSALLVQYHLLLQPCRYFLCWSQEAGYCCRGSEGSGAVMRLPGQAQDELWAAVNKGDGAAARRITTPLRLNPTAVSQPAAAAAAAALAS